MFLSCRVANSTLAGDDLSPTPPSLMARQVHPLAASGFNADQSIYEFARPSYPPAVVELVKQEIVPALGNPASASSLSVLDLAAGTGKWTRLIRSFGIGQLVAVEPSPGMRKEFQQLYPDIVMLDGSGTAIPLPDASVDVIFIAQVRDVPLNFEKSMMREGHLEGIMSTLGGICSILFMWAIAGLECFKANEFCMSFM